MLRVLVMNLKSFPKVGVRLFSFFFFALLTGSVHQTDNAIKPEYKRQKVYVRVQKPNE